MCSILLVLISLATSSSSEVWAAKQKVVSSQAAPQSVHPIIEATPPAIIIPAVGLGSAIKKKSNGLQFEEGSSVILRQEAQNFVAFRRNKMSPKKKLLWIAECFRRPGENIFCDYIVERRGGQIKSDLPATEPVARMDPFRLSELLSKRDLKPLQNLTEPEFHRALRLFPSWEPLQGIATAALAADKCPSSALLTALGQKAEEFFPDEKYRKIAMGLFAKSAGCGEDESAEKARFRLSLFLIWEKNCKQAEPHLTKLSETKDGEFISRSLFWRVQCAKQSGNKLLAAVMRTRLLKEYPLSYHGLLLSRGRTQEVARILDIKDPSIHFRSQSVPELNPIVRGIEMLQSLGAYELANEMIEVNAERISRSETAFRLYVALLMSRSGDMIAQFKNLSAIFKDEPSSITRATLQLYYPLKRFDVMRRYSSKVDPYLISALIRQESGFNENARSPAGALGLMQLMPDTARRMERVSRRELMDAKTNIRLGVKYFYGLLDRYELDAELALAAYNAGPERVDEWKKRYPFDNRMLFFDLIPFRETRNYVALIARNYYWYRSLYESPNWIGAITNRNPAASPSSLVGSPKGSTTKKQMVFTLFGG